MNYTEEAKNVIAVAPASTNTAQTGDIVSLKNYGSCYIELIFTQAVADETTVTIYESDDVSGSNTTAVSTVMPIWSNSDITTSDTLTRQTDAATYTLANTAKNQHVVIKVDASILTAGYPCIYVYTAASSQETDFVTAVYHLCEPRYAEDVPPTAITD